MKVRIKLRAEVLGDAAHVGRRTRGAVNKMRRPRIVLSYAQPQARMPRQEVFLLTWPSVSHMQVLHFPLLNGEAD